MPELPEVEVVRAGMQGHFAGSRITRVTVLAPRPIRRQPGGRGEFTSALVGQELSTFERRGKFMWIPLDAGDKALVIHLGMSGQVLAQTSLHELPRHSRVVLQMHKAPHLVFADQRMFGGMHVERLAESQGRPVPESMMHIAADPFETSFDLDSAIERIRRSNSAIKSVILNQTVVSGIGNIYADEALWRSRLDWARPASSLSRAKVRELLTAAAAVMDEALAQGGTSFDSMYVNVNGSSGYFSRGLQAYGQDGNPCSRCGTAIIREKFENRSAHRCPRCQRRSARA